MEPRTLLSAVVWTGDGGDNNWDTTTNWNTGSVPGSTDDVTINTTADVVHSSAVTDSINSLTSTEPLTISGGTLSIATTSTTSANLTISGGTLTATGDLMVGGLLTLTAGVLSGPGAVDANGGILIDPTTGVFGLDGPTLTNAAGQTATWASPAANIVASDGAVFNNLGNFLAQNNGTFSQGAGAASSFNNAGSFTKSNGAGELDFGPGVAFNVSTGGTVDVQSGTLGFLAGGTDTGAAFTIQGGATLEFGGSTPFTLDSATTFSGAGSLTKDGSTTLVLAGNSPSFTGATTVNGGTLLVDGSQPGSAVSVLNGSTLGGSGTVNTITTTGSVVSPGDGPGILNAEGNVSFDGASTFKVELDGANPGPAGYGQLNVTGAVNLGGSTLNASLGFTSATGETFTIIQSTAPIMGTFNGLPPGASLTIGAVPFQISYADDDVVLTQVQVPAITSAAGTTFVIGSMGTFTVTATGLPTPSLSETGALPTGVTFVDNGNGTATLAGTPAAGSAGTYPLTITASNGVLHDATQSFTLTVAAPTAPSITSAAGTTFAIGTLGTFTVTTTGLPAPSLSETGALPTGVTFMDNGDGTATLAGTPAAGNIGTYPLTITASNGVLPAATQNFTLTVNAQVLAITSPAATTFTTGEMGTFTVTTTGIPIPTLSETGALPMGVTFVDNGNGTATLAGTPAASSAGTYPLSIIATNGVLDVVTQSFTLTVTAQPLAITSAAATTFAIGTLGTFTVTTTGLPTPSLSETGTLPAGVTFVDNGNGTATLAGTPPAGSAGTYALAITATNGALPADTQSQGFTLTVAAPTAPAITSAADTTFTASALGTFTVTTTGLPTPSLSETGALPAGVTFADNGNGTATLTGTPTLGSAGTYPLTITATNGVLDVATQTFTLTVVLAVPTVTGLSPTTGPAAGGTSVTITGTGFSGSTVVEFGTTAATGVTVVNGTTIIAVSPAGTGVVNVIVTTSGGPSVIAPADRFTYIVPPPSVVSLVRFGVRYQPTSLVLTFSTALDATPAQNLSNYRLVTLGGRGKVGKAIRVRAVVYNPATFTVTLFPAQRLPLQKMYRLTVNGTTPSGLTGATGVPLAGQGNGLAGTNYVAVVSGKNLAGPAAAKMVVVRHSTAAGDRLIKAASASAVDHLMASGKFSAREIAARRHDRPGKR